MAEPRQRAAAGRAASRRVRVAPQPTPDSCGPTCLHGVYRSFGLEVPIEQLIREIPSVTGGGTLAVLLGIDALARGFRARLYSCNLRVLDPTWFRPERPVDLPAKLEASRRRRRHPKERRELEALHEFVSRGGELRMEPLTRELFRRHLCRHEPVLTGLSSTFLYRDPRQNPESGTPDDLAGESEGHFVVLSEFDRTTRLVTVNDPWPHTPFEDPHRYHVHVDRLINAILLGVLTFDANLLVVRPRT